MIEGERHIGGNVSVDRHYLIASLAASAEPIARAVRAHWQVKNGCNWILDMTFREDDSQIRCGHRAENFSTLRHFSLSLVKRHASKLSVRNNRIRAGFRDDFRQRLIAGAAIYSAVGYLDDIVIQETACTDGNSGHWLSP